MAGEVHLGKFKFKLSAPGQLLQLLLGVLVVVVLP